MANKKTQKDYFNEIIAVLNATGEHDDLVAFCEDRIEKLNNKSGSSKKPTKTQIENEGVKETILEVLTELDAPASATTIAMDPRVNASNQKVTALLKQLKDSGKVERLEEKGKALFTIKAE